LANITAKAILGVATALTGAGYVKLANQQAGYLPSPSLIRTFGAQREILLCETNGYRRFSIGA
jgi:hypothetical protein